MLIEAKDDGGGGDNWTTGAISRAKLQSYHHHQQTNIQFFLQTGCPSCRPTNSQSTEGKDRLRGLTNEINYSRAPCTVVDRTSGKYQHFLTDVMTQYAFCRIFQQLCLKRMVEGRTGQIDDQGQDQ